MENDDVVGSPTLRPTATAPFVAVSTLLAVLFVYDYAVDPSLVEFQQYDWVLAITLVVYGGVPLARNPERARTGVAVLASDARRRPRR